MILFNGSVSFLFFFFSSRRRHTRWPRDWSSDVCSSDLPLLAKYFDRSSESYIVKEKLRSTIIFSEHNLIKNPPFSKMDLVSCRNLLIYFQPVIQKKALDFLHYALKMDGILVLGTSESVSPLQKNFEIIHRKWKIYRNIQPNKNLNKEIGMQ